MKREWRSTSEQDTHELGCELGAALRPAGALLLSGDLGAGKTVLAKGVAEACGVDPAEVQSPTFTLVREHPCDAGTFVHIDLYRLEEHEVPSLGLEEILLGQEGVKVVEWAERLPFSIPGARWLEIRLGASDGERWITELRDNDAGEDAGDSGD